MEDGITTADIVDFSIFSLGWMEKTGIDELLTIADILLSVDLFKELLERICLLLLLSITDDLNHDSILLGDLNN